MGQHVEEAKELLFGEGGLDVSDIKIFRGDRPDLTPDMIAEQVVKVIRQLEAGDFEEVVF